VANTRIPALAASRDVAATVVPAVRFPAIAIPRSRLLTLITDSSSAIRASSESSSPAFGTPSTTAIVAGVTPASVSIASKDRAASRFPGLGRPCEMIVDSSATTGRPASSAASTGDDNFGTRNMSRHYLHYPAHPPLPRPPPRSAVRHNPDIQGACRRRAVSADRKGLFSAPFDPR
jgi:hypothetical protein